jgi:UDP-arabinose 4-epimerase
MPSVLVTGGAGYIGRHTCEGLAAAGVVPVTLDNLAIGDADAVRWGPFMHGDVLNPRALEEAAQGCAAVIHLAAWSDVGEGEANPRKYRENIMGALAVAALGLPTVFASSAAVYGDGAGPVSNYGRSKVAGEMALPWATALRYFNVAGGQGDKGDHIVPRTMRALQGHAELVINGDGSCVRDYVHVDEVAAANVAAVEKLLSGAPGVAVDVCTGRPTSVSEVVAACEAFVGWGAKVTHGPARQGDPQAIVGDPRPAAAHLGWKASLGLMSIVSSWEA